LNFEKDLNSQLKGEIGLLEHEKDSLLVKLKEEEDLGHEIAHETNSVSTSLNRKVDDLKRLELEHDANSRRLRELNEQLEVLRSQEINTRQ
jgi:vacuolar-type H+-ATPase subunit I/STV1